MAAYALARLNFPLRNAIFMMFIGALMVPGIVLLIPNFVLMYDLGWINTYQGIVAPTVLMSPFAIFFLRQFFLGINRDLERRLDGAGYFEVFWRIIRRSQTAQWSRWASSSSSPSGTTTSGRSSSVVAKTCAS